MLFKYYVFILFLPAVLVIYYLTPAKVKNLILFLASFVFICGEPKYSVLLLFLLQPAIWVEDASNIRDRRSVSVLLIRQTDPENTRVDMTGLWSGFYGNDIGIAGIFKYMDFLADSVNRDSRYTCSDGADRTSGRHQFYTFQIISYYVDVYRGEVAAEHNFVDFAAYVTMFPQLIAGPIVRFQSVQAELKHREITWEKTGKVRQGSSVASVKGFDRRFPCTACLDTAKYI